MKKSALKIVPASPPALGEVFEFLRVIWAVDHAVQRTSKRVKKTLGVTGPQRFVIRIVGRFPGITAGQLAKILHVHPSTLTATLKRLERDDLIRRRADTRDARRSLLGLSQKGMALDVDTKGTIEAAIRTLLRRTSPGKIQITRQVLEGIIEILES